MNKNRCSTIVSNWGSIVRKLYKVRRHMRINMPESKINKWVIWKCIVIKWAKLAEFWSILLILLCIIMRKLMGISTGIRRILMTHLEG